MSHGPVGILGRTLEVFGSSAAGLFTGVCAVALHDTWWGLAVGVFGSVALMFVVGPGRTGRLPAAVCWLLALFFALRGRPEGDFAIGANLRGQLLLGLGLVVLAFAIWSGVRGSSRTPIEA